MWRWQRVNIRKITIHKRYILWAKLCATSCVAHVIFLFFLFFLYRTRVSDFTLVISKHMLNRDVSVLLAQAQIPATKKTQQRATTARTVKQTPQKKIIAQKKVVKKPAALKVPKTAVINKKQNVAPQKKPTQPKKPVVQKKVAPAKKQIAQKKIPPKKSVQKIVQKKAVSPAKQRAKNNAQDQNESVAINAGQQYDTEALLRYAALQKEFVRCWKPPIGVPKNCSCEIKLFVNAAGKVHDMHMIRPSGILMYDVAARSALSAMTLPRWTRNKALTITFK